MNPETIGCKQRAVYWAPITTGTTHTSTGRQRVTSSKVELKVRWEATKSDMLDENGQTIRLDARVKVLQAVGVGGLMWFGKLKALPATPTNLYEIVGLEEVPSRRAGRTERWALLQRYSDALPPTE